jgi:large subunit ribosomal protein LP0
MPLSPERKEWYFSKLRECIESYNKLFLVNVDNVGSNQIQQIRQGLRGTAEILMGKNTMIRKCIRDFLAEEGNAEHPIANILPKMVGNVAFVWTNGDLAQVRTILEENRVPAPARVGSIAPCDVYCPAGGTGCDPGQTSFFQALNIPTKISKGQIEIISPVLVCKTGEKVGNSEAVLLQRMDIRPFSYGLVVSVVYDNGNMYDPAVLDLTDEILTEKFMAGVKVVAAIARLNGWVTLASLPHTIGDAFNNCVAVALVGSFSFEQANAYKSALPAPAAEPEPAAEE